MKKSRIYLFTLLILSLIAISCDELLDQLNLDFTVGPHQVEFTIEPANQGDIFNEFDVYIHELTEEIEAKGGKMDQLDKVSLKSATISIVSGATNFNAFKSFDVFIKTPLKAEKKIASMENVPMDVTSITPAIIGDNLKDFMLEDEYTIVLKGVLRENITQNVNLEAEIFFDINL